MPFFFPKVVFILLSILVVNYYCCIRLNPSGFANGHVDRFVFCPIDSSWVKNTAVISKHYWLVFFFFPSVYGLFELERRSMEHKEILNSDVGKKISVVVGLCYVPYTFRPITETLRVDLQACHQAGRPIVHLIISHL